MSEQKSTGDVAWMDLTVKEAEKVRDFYARVAGWSFKGQSMGDYDDYCMENSAGKTVAGICHARGPNQDLPPQWLIYITVPNLAEAMTACEANGGAVLRRPEQAGPGQFAVIRDPAGAVAALYQT